MTNIEDLYREYHDRIYHRCYSMVHSHEVAEDLTQDTFVRALGSALRDESKPGGWLYVIATNACIDYLRHKRLLTITLSTEEVQTLSESSDPFVALAEDELIDRAFAHLRPSYQKALRCWLEDKHSMSHNKMMVHRARQEFREAYRQVEEVGA